MTLIPCGSWPGGGGEGGRRALSLLLLTQPPASVPVFLDEARGRGDTRTVL